MMSSVTFLESLLVSPQITSSTIPARLLMSLLLLTGTAPPIEEIQTTISRAAYPEQAVKLRQYLTHIDELKAHKREIELEILTVAESFSDVLDFLYMLPRLDKNPMTALAIFSEINLDMSVFPSSKHLVSQAGCYPRNDQSNGKVKFIRISHIDCCLKPFLVQVTNALIKSKRHPEFKERYHRIKSNADIKKQLSPFAKCF
mgnify:CR=1 FL=1